MNGPSDKVNALRPPRTYTTSNISNMDTIKCNDDGQIKVPKHPCSECLDSLTSLVPSGMGNHKLPQQTDVFEYINQYDIHFVRLGDEIDIRLHLTFTIIDNGAVCG